MTTTTPDGGENCSRHDDGETVMDVKLFKAIGLYHLLQPVASGGFSRRSRIAFLAVLWLIAGLLIMQLFRLYLTCNDLQTFIYSAMLMTIGLNCLFKGYVMVTNAERLRAVLDVTLYGFTSCGRCDPSELRCCRETLFFWLRMFVGFGYVTAITWIVSPLFIVEYSPYVKLDGTVGHYRQSIINFWFPVSEAMYNWTPVWTLIYMIETVVSLTYTLLLMLFDSYLVTVCMVLSAQFRTMSAAYKTLGSRSPQPLSHPLNSHIKIDDMNVDYYEEMFDHIKDNQKLVKKFDELFDVVRSAVLLHITSGTYSGIALIFLTIIAYFTDGTIVTPIVIKYSFGFILLTFEIYIYCYLFDYLENAKSSINFGLYSSNWTEMDLKFKKTLLLVMILNSTHKRVMKITPKFIINLEMFTRVMNISYSILSVLLNSNAKKVAKT